MSWIFNTQAEPGTNPWKWEWGSPASFAGRRSCGCLRSEVCRCYQSRKSAPPAAPAPYVDPFAGAARASAPPGLLEPTFLSDAQYPQARIQCGRAGNDILNQYYQRKSTYAGALVYIKPNISSDPAAAAQDYYYKPCCGRPTFTTDKEWPQARIDHGRAGYDILWQYFQERSTYSGAMVNIKPNCKPEPADFQ